MDEKELLKERFKSAISSAVKAISEDFKLNIKFGNEPDSKGNSLNLPEVAKLKSYQLQNTEIALALGNIEIREYELKKQKEEVEMLKTSRKGIYYLNDLKKGKKVTSKNLFLRRPWGGLSLFDVKKILKHRLVKDVKKNEKLKINDFKK